MRDCDSPKIALENAVLTADEQIRAQSEQSRERRGMATTLLAACVDDSLNCTVVNVGDSWEIPNVPVMRYFTVQDKGLVRPWVGSFLIRLSQFQKGATPFTQYYLINNYYVSLFPELEFA